MRWARHSHTTSCVCYMYVLYSRNIRCAQLRQLCKVAAHSCVDSGVNVGNSSSTAAAGAGAGVAWMEGGCIIHTGWGVT
jgi:hypothetical protein